MADYQVTSMYPSWSTHECGSSLRKETLWAPVFCLPWEHIKKIAVREWISVDLNRHLTWHTDLVFPVFLCWKLLWLFFYSWVRKWKNACTMHHLQSSLWWCVDGSFMRAKTKAHVVLHNILCSQFLVSSSTPSSSCPAKVEDTISLQLYFCYYYLLSAIFFHFY